MGRSTWSMAVYARWVLSIGIAAAVLYGSSVPAQPWPHYVLVGVVLLGNALLAWHWSRLKSHLALWAVVLADVVAVTLTITLTRQAAADLYLFYFVVLLAAATTQSWRAFVTATMLTCAIYGGVLYADVGARLWFDAALLLRVPFLLCVSIFVGLAAHRARADEDSARSVAEALSDIGTLAIGCKSTGQVLYAIANKMQSAMQVDRCSLILFEDDFRHGYLAASGDDKEVGTRLLTIRKYPEIMAVVKSREIVELHADQERSLWRRVQASLPESVPFRSFLIVPLLLRGDLMGVYFLRARAANRMFSDHDQTFCQVVAMMTATFVNERELERELARELARETPEQRAAAEAEADEDSEQEQVVVASDVPGGSVDDSASAAETLEVIRPAA